MKNLFPKLLLAAVTFSIGTFVQTVVKHKQKPIIEVATQKQDLTELSFSRPEYTLVEPGSESNQTESEDYFSGWYSVDDFGKMKEVWTILVSKDDEKSTEQKAVWYANVLTDNENNDFQAVWVVLDNNRLNFKTKKVKGVEYKFEGVFFKGKKSGEDGEKLLKGSLQKFVKGKRVATIDAEFAYYEPHCWH